MSDNLVTSGGSATSDYADVITDSLKFLLALTLTFNSIIDYKSSEGYKIFEKATSKLSYNPFTCTAMDTHTFLDQLTQ